MHILIAASEKNRSRMKEIEKVALGLGCILTQVSGLESAITQMKAKPERSNLLVVAGDTEMGVAEVEQLANSTIQEFKVFYISDSLTADDYKRLLHLGFVDASEWSAAARELVNFIARQQPLEESKTNHSGYMVSFISGGGGGVGNTTLAMETGIALASDLNGKQDKVKKQKVALLDLNLESSIVCEYLNLKPKLDLSGIAANPARLDGFMIEMLAAQHSPAFDIFANIPPSAEDFEAPRNSILELLNCMDEIYTTVILDIPNKPPIDTKEILDASDLIVLTGLYNVPSINMMKKKYDSLIASGRRPDRIAVALTDTGTNFFGVIERRFDLSSIFPGTQIMYVRRDRDFAIECVDVGASMVQTKPQAGISKDIINIAKFIKEKSVSSG